jgi:hypothetical protein
MKQIVLDFPHRDLPPFRQTYRSSVMRILHLIARKNEREDVHR